MHEKRLEIRTLALSCSRRSDNETLTALAKKEHSTAKNLDAVKQLCAESIFLSYRLLQLCALECCQSLKSVKEQADKEQQLGIVKDITAIPRCFSRKQ